MENLYVTRACQTGSRSTRCHVWCSRKVSGLPIEDRVVNRDWLDQTTFEAKAGRRGTDQSIERRYCRTLQAQVPDGGDADAT